MTVALVAMLGLGAAGEVLMRFAPGVGGSQFLIRSQADLNRMVYAPDPDLGALLAPSLRDSVETVDFSYTLRTDHAGFPNPEPWPDQVDVAVLGNSLLVGPGVGMEGEFTTLLQNRLDGRMVLNLGLPGGGTQHELLTYRRFAAPLRPKLVVAVLWVVWDIDNSIQFAHWVREGRPDSDYTHYRYTYNETHGREVNATGSSDAAPSELAGVARAVRNRLGRSQLLRAGVQGMRSILADEGMTVSARFPDGDEVLLGVRDQERLVLGMDREGEPDLRSVFFSPLEQLRSEVEEAGGRFVIVLMPSKEEVYGAKASPAILRSIEDVTAGLEQRGLPTLDLYPLFHERGRERAPFYHADMHLNELGNQIVADAIAKWITEDGRIFARR